MMKRVGAFLFGVFAAFNALSADKQIFAGSGFWPNKLILNNSTEVPLIDQGWYSFDGFHDPDNQNYTAGICNSCVHPGEYRNWFVFDISGLSAPVASMSISLFTYVINTDSLIYYMYDYGGSIPDLVNGTGGVNAFADLGSGNMYGLRQFSFTESRMTRTIALTNQGYAVASLNQAIANHQAQWAIGGATTTGNPLPVPEPSTHALFSVGAVGVLLAARRKRK